MTILELLVASACICFIVGSVAWMFYFLGKVTQQAKQATEISSISALVGFFAASEARGLRNSTVIQRVVEKYNVIKDPQMTKEAEKLQDDLEKALDPFYEPKEKKHVDQYNFDDIDIKDQV